MEHNRRKHAGQADVDRELCPAEYLGGGVDPEVVNAANGVTPNGDVYGNLVGGGFQITGASTPTRAFWARYRQVAAQARARLVAAASETWGVAPEEVEINSGSFPIRPGCARSSPTSQRSLKRCRSRMACSRK